MAADAKASILIEIQNNAKKGLEDFNKQFASTIAPVQHLGRLAAAAVVGIGAAITGAAVVSIREAAKFQQTSIAFSTMLGSGKEAQAFLAQLANFAAATPFEIPEIEQNAKQLLAMGFSVNEVIPTLKSLGDISAGLSVPLEQVALAYGQVRTANQLYGTELRQFVQAGVPIIAELANQFGVTEARIKKMTEEGLISFKDVEKAFQSMSGEGGKFANLMAAQSQTVMGQWSNMKDNLILAAREIGKGIIPPLTDALTKLNAKLKEWRTNYAEDIGKVLTTTITAAANIGKALLAGFKVLWDTIGPTITKTFNGLNSALTFLGTLWTQTIGKLNVDWTEGWAFIVSTVQLAWNTLMMPINVGWSILQSVFSIGTDILLGNWSSAWAETQNIVINAWNGIVGYVQDGVNTIISGINFIIGSAQNLGVEITKIGEVDFANFTAQTKMSTNQMQKATIQNVNYQDAALSMGNATKLATKEVEKLSGTGGGGGGAKGASKSVKELTSELNKLTETFGSLKEAGTASILKLFGQSNDKLANLRQQYKDLGKEIKDLQLQFKTEQQSSNKDFASAIVEQQQKVIDLQKELEKKKKELAQETSQARMKRLESDDEQERRSVDAQWSDKKSQMEEEISLLETQLSREQNALNSSADIQKQLRADITEAKRRASLTDFERALEDYKLDKELKEKQFNEEKARLEAKQQNILDQVALERKAYSQLYSSIQEQIGQATVEYNAFVNDQRVKTEEAVAAMIRQYEELAQAIRSINLPDIQISSSKKTTKTMKPTTKKFAKGVDNFEGGWAMVGEKGPEMVRLPQGSDVIPNHKLGNNITINIMNAQVLDKNDVIDKIGDPIIALLKQHFAVV